MGLCQGEGLLMLYLIWGDLLKISEPKIRSCFLFVDLEQVFYQVQREVVHFALRQKGVPEYSVDGVMSLYKDCKTRVSVDGELSSSFSVKVGVCLESALSLFLFIMVMDVLTEDVRDGSLLELLYVDDFVLSG